MDRLLTDEHIQAIFNAKEDVVGRGRALKAEYARERERNPLRSQIQDELCELRGTNGPARRPSLANLSRSMANMRQLVQAAEPGRSSHW